METHELTAHPAHPPLAVRSVEARIIGHDSDWLRLRWRIEGSQQLIVPEFAGRGRADQLWQTTCFEFFARPDGEHGYSEFNLSPSERWAAYDFEDRRIGMTERDLPREPVCTMRVGSSFAIFDAAVPAAALPRLPADLGLSCVLEEQGGAKSYWALAHPKPDPDFHDPACFAARLLPPGAA